MIYVDANYWIYYFDERLPEHEYVVEPVRAAIREGVVASFVTLVEVAHYFRHLPREELLKKVGALRNLATLRLVPLDAEVFELALEKLARYARVGIGARDSVILATMEVAGVRTIATHDDAFKRVEEVEVLDAIPP